MSNLYPDDPRLGIHTPVWMPIEELSQHENVYPVGVAELVAKSARDGWPKEIVVVVEEPT